jgi:hypothetical protein
MKNKLYNVLIPLAVVFILTGIVFSFVDLECIGIQPLNSGYVSAIFSLSGVLFFFAALVYQIKEYKLQVEELKKSVEAQTRSSEALDEQKRLLLEQNINSLIFGMIDSFNSFKERNNIPGHIDKWHAHYQGIFKNTWQENSYKLKLNNHDFNIKLAQEIKRILNSTFPSYYDSRAIKKYLQFAYNILIIIDRYFPNDPNNIFKPFFLCQLNSKEIAVIYFSNLIDSNIPLYNNLRFDFPTTVEMVDMIKSVQNLPSDLMELDCAVLVEEFNRLRQQ